ncbi:ribosome maturation factor RimP [Cellulomonas sp. APG4]|uniref:ribosome maturation factor RimP n=1 Tax=Cellulomonas sp. APG4 TaxID=1538656 RepID=UPI001379884D|nr:ribosome maturation factor RimP [Cellulomonas sp. APG4]NCT92204.1 ribosome maturation factor RimP [Cellulomonas sp. APG4]
MAASQVERVREVVQPVVGASGLYLEDVVVAPAGRRTVVRVVLDLDEDAVGSLDLDTVGEVSREISAAMDAADPVRGAYVLEVSTPGTDRPLTEPRHFRRARTRLVTLELTDGSSVRGRLAEADASAYVLVTDDGEVEIEPSRVSRGRVEVELRRGDETGLDETEEA